MPLYNQTSNRTNLGQLSYSITTSGNLSTVASSATSFSFELDPFLVSGTAGQMYDINMVFKSPNISKTTCVKSVINYGKSWNGSDFYIVKTLSNLVSHSDSTANPGVLYSCPTYGGPITVSVSGLDNSGGAIGIPSVNIHMTRLQRP